MDSTNKSTILLVDDIESNLYALEQTLDNENRIILKANSGNEALKILLKEKVDLIILDVQMPEMDGFEVAQIVKSNRSTKDIPIIFATAHLKEQQFMLKGLEEGAVDYLFKPLDPKITEAKVSVFLKLQSQKKELKEKNEALERSALLINNSADMMCIINPQNLAIETMNTAVVSMLGFEPEEFRNRFLLDFIEAPFHSEIQIHRHSQSERIFFEVQSKSSSGQLKWLNWHIINRNKLWFANIRDVTDLKDYETKLKTQAQELQMINQELESFSYSVSHDLRAPLRAIDGFSNALINKLNGSLEDDSKKYFSFIQQNVNNMEQLIDGLLSFSKLGRKELRKEQIDFDDLVPSIVEVLLNQNDTTIIRINPLGKVEGDITMIRQIWQNLISNAIKYSSNAEKPEIEVGQINKNDIGIYYVKDNGVGFDMEYADKLFEVFQRLHSSEEFEGTGIGLATVKRIINRHGGNIWAESEVGNGATFFFTLPSISRSSKY